VVRPRAVLVVAATSLLTLAASGVTSSPAGAGQATATAPSVTASGSSTAAGDCSKAEALAAVKRLGLGQPEVTNPVYKVLCGAFAGPASKTMVVSLMGAGSAGMIDWVVFGWTGSEWQLQLKRRQAALLSAAGSDIRETVFIFRPGDSHCCPSGGTRSRVWHWNGTSFMSGPWKQATKAEPGSSSFYSPSRGIDCGMLDQRGIRAVICQTLRPPQKVTMDVLGRLKICSGSEARCKLGNAGDDVPVLAYGRQITVGRFRCLSLRSGVRCTLIRTGRGFLINRQGVHRIRAFTESGPEPGARPPCRFMRSGASRSANRHPSLSGG
jgi:hypothetical protein